ncbi:putative Holliday junction resolvase [Holospora obtusa F1]|uniref:Putative pre-16S rRNA nuclease n=1 Tax=Holospora obtusa F1 TaxID=1399147 RepID=W6TE93_HOLOB|nr:Holliday junction resolvase RuvX [Holospora obtusa]ETZ07478.1 putative Holliday junction resolvase [Holospora obtusa F1]
MRQSISLENHIASGLSGCCLGIDLGKKFTGISISNPENTLAVPLKTLPTSSYDRLGKKVVEILRDYSVSWIVLGLPLNLDGSWSKGCDLVSKFSEFLAPYPVCFWDERLSTVSARRLLCPGSKNVNAQAAAVILQHALDRLNYLKNMTRNQDV